jgi:hypothetical protein
MWTSALLKATAVQEKHLPGLTILAGLARNLSGFRVWRSDEDGQMITSTAATDRHGARSARADPYRDPHSIEFRFRARRFAEVRRLIQAALDERGHCDILDLGGTETYWLVGRDLLQANRSRLTVTILNTEPQEIGDRTLFGFVEASATQPGLFAGRSFDLVLSNSVIEHVGSWQDMQKFARNVRRLARRYYVQTPNYWFPFEPHFRFPGFQYLPTRVRVALLMRRSLGFFPRIADRAEAEKIVGEHALLSTRQIAELFPDATVSHEKFLGLSKSIVAVRG